MNIKIMTKSKKNTKKIAKIMGQALNVSPIEIKKNLVIEPTDVMFLGCGIYGGDVLPEVKEFVKTLDKNIVKKVVLFSTSGSGEDQTKALREVLVEQGIVVAENTFCCKSRSFIFINKGCPTQEDFEDAKNFAKKMITESETI